jgi:3-deoxy-D-manno-octulosonic-acid transferase
LILSSAARRVPMVLINGRMSQRSFPRWRRVVGTISALLGKFEVCLAQSPDRCGSLSTLGSRNVVVTETSSSTFPPRRPTPASWNG